MFGFPLNDMNLSKGWSSLRSAAFDIFFDLNYCGFHKVCIFGFCDLDGCVGRLIAGGCESCDEPSGISSTTVGNPGIPLQQRDS
ncbi:uncharacterized protein LOC144494876 [Mustelus asterias]